MSVSDWFAAEARLQWAEEYRETHRGLCTLGLYSKANELLHAVYESPSVGAASQVIERYQALLPQWRDDAWLRQAGEIAAELHALGYPDQARQLMTSVQGAFNQDDAEEINRRYIKLLEECRAARTKPSARYAAAGGHIVWR